MLTPCWLVCAPHPRAPRPFMTYSQGVRQALSRMFGAGGPYAEGGPKHRKDYMIMGPAREYSSFRILYYNPGCVVTRSLLGRQAPKELHDHGPRT